MIRCLLFVGLSYSVVSRCSALRIEKLRIEERQSISVDMSIAEDCLRLTTPSLQLEYPSDANDHFDEITEALKPYEHCAFHSYAGYHGPWIENHWMSHFRSLWSDEKQRSGDKARLSTVFGPFIPIFFPFVDCWIKHHNHNEDGLARALKDVLRPDVAYITVSQSDSGLDLPFMQNVVVLSAGGYGNVPVPLLAGPKSVEKLVPMDQRPLLANYVGSLVHAPHDMRHRMAESMHRSFQPNEMFVGQSVSWEHIMADSRVSLVPRGFGRTAFHLAETIQKGLVPVYVYDDVPWVPYKDMFEQLGYVLNIDEVEPFLKNLSSVSIADLEAKEAMSLKVKDSHFSFPGVMRQIEGFMAQNRGTHDLKCQRVPDTVRGA